MGHEADTGREGGIAVRVVCASKANKSNRRGVRTLHSIPFLPSFDGSLDFVGVIARMAGTRVKQ